MTVYNEPSEATGGGVRSLAGAGATPLAPNSTVNRLVCSASLASRLCCPGSPFPETTIPCRSPGPVMRACDGPFARAGVASVMTAVTHMPAARAVTMISLRSMGRLLIFASAFLLHRHAAGGSRGPAVSARRVGDRERRRPAEVAFQPQRDPPGAP